MTHCLQICSALAFATNARTKGAGGGGCVVIALLLHSGGSCATITDKSGETLRVLSHLPVRPKSTGVEDVAWGSGDNSRREQLRGREGTTYNEKREPISEGVARKIPGTMALASTFAECCEGHGTSLIQLKHVQFESKGLGVPRMQRIALRSPPPPPPFLTSASDVTSQLKSDTTQTAILTEWN